MFSLVTDSDFTSENDTTESIPNVISPDIATSEILVLRLRKSEFILNL